MRRRGGLALFDQKAVEPGVADLQKTPQLTISIENHIRPNWDRKRPSKYCRYAEHAPADDIDRGSCTTELDVSGPDLNQYSWSRQFWMKDKCPCIRSSG